ncbi:hypothetical protein F4777DRAFT_208593 [Nemania sp. FL0916]|nr:hypothetical protein F4777DRAFT_208593 [Nemania sp. FL0916]
MAAQGPTQKSKTGIGGLPAKWKNFVQDMKSPKKYIYRHRRGVASEQIRSSQPSPSGYLPPATQEAPAVPSLSRDSPRVRSLSIRVTVNFGEPLSYAHSQDYEGSSSLRPTEELCEALIRRVDHCSKELITRRDSSALDRTGTDGLAKPLRYEIQLQVLRNEPGTGTEAWASRTLRSYQRLPLSTEAAREVILSTHYMVGLFLRHHDEAFVWKDGPVQEDLLQEQKTFPYKPGRVQPLTSIPRSLFIEKQQDFESIPGYTVCFSFTSQDHHRTPPRWHDTVEVNSRQLSPLTLVNAENLFLDACYAVDGVFRLQRREYGALQKSCASHSGCRHCRPQDGDGVEMLVSVKNNVGPLFDNLERTTWASVNVFWKDQATDCVEFIENARAAIVRVCHDTDESVSRMNDFEFYIIELRGRGWTIDEPLAFTLGPETCLCRRTVESLLDRLQTGVADVLRGNAIAVRMTARKRGHFILHKTLVAREPVEKPGSKKTVKSKVYVLDRLKKRIERDIDMVCRDTCTISSRNTEAARPDTAPVALSQDYSSLNTGLISSRRLSDLTTPSNMPTSNDENSSGDRLESRGSELVETAEPSSSSSSVPQHQWARITRDPVTGVRLFPLVPDRRSPHDHTTATYRPPTRHNETGQNGTTITSFDQSTSHEQSSAFTGQTTSESSTSNTGQESAGTSLVESRGYGRGKYPTEGSTGSTRPRTPDLDFGGSPSIHSSVIITPKIHELVLNNDIDIVRQSTPGVEGGESDENGEGDNYLTKLYMQRPGSSPTLLDTQDSAIASTINKPRPVRKEQRYSIIGTTGISSGEAGTSSQPNPETEGAPFIELTSDTVPMESVTDQGTSIGEYHHGNLGLEREAEAEGFSQSKPDYNFSSPLTVTSSEDSEAAKAVTPPDENEHGNIIITPSEQEENRDTESSEPSVKDKDEENDNDANDDDSSAVDLSSSAPRPEPSALQHQHSKSFSSAGYLGSFREQRFYGVGLRGSLGSSTPPPRPMSRFGFREEDQERPGTAM